MGLATEKPPPGGDLLARERAIAGPLAASGETLPETVIASQASVQLIQSLKDLWEYRDLFWAFVTRDIKVRYKQTALGVLWVILQPLAAAGIFTVVFQQLGAAGSANPLRQFLFLLAGLVPWNGFAMGVQNAATSMEGNAGLITKVYFPRLVIPGAYVCGSAVDFLVSYTVLLGAAVYAGCWSPLLLALMPLLLVVQLAFAAALGLVFGALNAQYRDVKYVVPFLLTMGMVATVLLDLGSLSSPALRAVLSFNPMAAVVESYRSILSGRAIDGGLLVKGAAVSFASLAVGIWFFRARESRMVDIL